MSSDDYFDDDIDAAFLDELDALEATQVAGPSKQPDVHPPLAKAAPAVSADDSDYFDLTFDVDEGELQKLDGAIEDAYRNKGVHAPAPARSKSFSRVPSKGGRQTTLFGDVLPEAGPSSRPAGPSHQLMQRTKSSGPKELFRKTKTWDQTAFSKTGMRKRKASKGKEKARAMPEDEDGEEDVEFEQFPAPFVSSQSPLPMKLKPDLLAAKSWVFPLNRPKRDYQYNIAKHCLFENTLVALPTGLGKTFIAGVVMLNFYRWFPEGKVIFVAPTKPLVAQQIDACHKTCGIPGRDAVELTGNNPKPFRAKAWREKRIFYMTPQTLENDLKSETGDPRDISLLVIDEAHKGTGDYAYAKVVRHLMAKNPHFRVLALTATPGSTPDAVQAIIDGLHISRIEIRDERSLDIRNYINEKKIEQHIIPMNEEIGKLRDLLATVMKRHITKLTRAGLLRGNLDPVHFHPYRAQVAMAEVHTRPDSRSLVWAYPLLKKIGTLARAMGYLLEASPQMCHTSLTAEAEGIVDANGKKSGGSNSLNQEEDFQTLMNELKLQKSRGFAVHPKMAKLKMLVINHFGQKTVDEDVEAVGLEGAATAEDTRVMVFVSFREAVGEIVEFLNQESPLIRATKFIGQGTDKQGKKGFAQREQLDIIKRFKDGDFNVLVSTSIGEEGLDIGEIDMIVCYEAQKTPIRMLQRVGRTGRKREGYVHVLLAEGREELNWNKAQEAYADVQQSIVRGEQLEFYADVERLLPDSVKPECVEMMMDIEEYDRAATERMRAVASPAKGTKKRKHTDDAGRSMPPGAAAGFVSVAELILKQGGKRGKKAIVFDEHALEQAGYEDEDDEAIEAGPFAALRRSASTSAVSSKKPSKAPKTKAKRARTMAEGTKKKTMRKKKSDVVQPDPPITELTMSQLARKGDEDSDDMEIERGLFASPPRKNLSRVGRTVQPAAPERRLSPEPFSSPDIPLLRLHDRSVIDICSSSSSRSPSLSPSLNIRMSSSPDQPLRTGTLLGRSLSARTSTSAGPSTSFHTSEPSSTVVSAKDHTTNDHRDLSWLLADSDDAAMEDSGPPRPSKPLSVDSDEVEFMDDVQYEDSIIVLPSSPTADSAAPKSQVNQSMPPPAHLPARFSRPVASTAPPELTFAARPVGRTSKRRTHVQEEASSPLRTPPPSQKRLRRVRDSTPPIPSPEIKGKKFKIQDTAAARKANPWIDVEASHSGDEVSNGSSDAEMEDEDREFLNEGSPTQASPSYDQFAAYRQSLLSQAPTGSKVPTFAGPPIRRGVAYRGVDPRKAGSSSSPVRQDESPDEYMLGSFIVDDEAEISYLQSSESGI